MIVADTSIWVEFLKKNEDVFTRMRSLLDNHEILGVECVFGELLQGARNDRECAIIEGYWENLPRLNETNLWIEAGRYSGEYKLLSKGIGLIDAAIIIAARRTESSIWTSDKKLARVLKKDDIFHISNKINDD